MRCSSGTRVVRGKRALLDLSLFRRPRFAAAAATNFLLPLALFGALIVLPLYYQFVRRQSPLDVGLLLIPQGVGAALAMPIAGRLTDKVGARPVVSAGLVVAVLGTLAYTRVGADTSYAYLAAALFVLGLGIGSTIMPSMAAAFQALAREEAPRATSALNAIQRIAGAIGTAAMAIVLQRAIADSVPDCTPASPGWRALSAQQRAEAAPALAGAFAATFWVAVGLIGLARAAGAPAPATGARSQAVAGEGAAGMTPATQTLHDWLLFLHVLAAMVWVGGGVMLSALAARALRDPDPAAVGRFTDNLRRVGPLVLAPATVAVRRARHRPRRRHHRLGFRAAVGAARARTVRAPRSCSAPPGRAAPPSPPPGQPPRGRRRSAPPAAPLVVGLPADRAAARRRRLGHDQQTGTLKGAEDGT